jgi:catechol 2,3-dioxygenase-like lactoylglutathione lyase family enzyme
MSQSIATVAVVVADYDEAIEYFCEKLQFGLFADVDLGGGKRWVVVGPAGGGARLLLARADGADQRAAIGNQTGGRVGFFLETDDFERDYRLMKQRGVVFREAPRQESYGTVAVFADLYGNRWDLIAPKPNPSARRALNGKPG